MSLDLSGSKRRLAIVGYHGADLVDITGPYEVFATANALARSDGIDEPYELDLISVKGQDILTDAGLTLRADSELGDFQGADTILVAGGVGKFAALSDKSLSVFLKQWQDKVRRIGSVCTGAFILAEAGILDGRRAVTHWRWCDKFRELYPQVKLEPDAIFIQDGNIFTTAGVTAGIDLALALVEADCGRELSMAVAREMVVFVKRPGGQAQFSTQLSLQMAQRTPIRTAQNWVTTHPEASPSVEELAELSGMSPRNFARVFKSETGQTPRQYVEKVKVERARLLLEEAGHSVERVAQASGFASAEVLRRTFLKHFGVPPATYARRFGAETG